MMSCGVHLKPISLKNLMIWAREVSVKNTRLKLQLPIPGFSDLIEYIGGMRKVYCPCGVLESERRCRVMNFHYLLFAKGHIFNKIYFPTFASFIKTCIHLRKC